QLAQQFFVEGDFPDVVVDDEDLVRLLQSRRKLSQFVDGEPFMITLAQQALDARGVEIVAADPKVEQVPSDGPAREPAQARKRILRRLGSDLGGELHPHFIGTAARLLEWMRQRERAFEQPVRIADVFARNPILGPSGVKLGGSLSDHLSPLLRWGAKQDQ